MNKVTVRIANTDFTVIGEEDKEYILGLGEFVNQRIDQIFASNKGHSLVQACVIAAMGIADEYFKQKLANRQLDESTRQPLHQLQEKNEQIDLLSEQLKNRETGMQELQGQLEEQQKTQLQLQEALDQEKDKYNQGLQKMKENEDLVNEYQNRLYELQMKVLELEKNSPSTPRLEKTLEP